MTCQYQSREGTRGAFTCALGLFGSRPFLGNCRTCIAQGENNPQFADSAPPHRTFKIAMRKVGCGTCPPIHFGG